MRRRVERIAASLPGSLNLTLLAAIATLLLVNMTDSWLPWHFVTWLRRFDALPGAAGSVPFCLFMLTAMFLYVMSMSACGLALAAALRAGVIRSWKLAGR
ncbi:hypothetical protein ACIP6T_23470 [Pantoea sp. NPDC088449]|uniref:hypothetical protein n=1 Tax=Pantoea sp. NPDC088449 TaxID=3364392 RepID=UPI003812A1F2